jgi:hypothetical protein
MGCGMGIGSGRSAGTVFNGSGKGEQTNASRKR